jgi:hypothetical protein
MEPEMSTVFLVGLIAGAGLMAAVIFGADAWYARRHPLTRERS